MLRGFCARAFAAPFVELAVSMIMRIKEERNRGMAEATDRTLRDVQIGSTATVRRLNGQGALKRHIMDMGITKGTEVYVRKVAPLGDPIEVTVRGYELSLRKSEAESILVS